MTLDIFCDFETRAVRNLKSCGSAPYFECPHFRPIILSWGRDERDDNEWTWGQPAPPDLAEAIRSGARIHAHNAAFERGCFDWLAAHEGWPRPRLEQYRCSMATAAALGLPQGLEDLGEALDLLTRKDKRGADLIKLFSVPRKGTTLFNEPADHPREFRQFVDYCHQDRRTEIAAERRMIPLGEAEQAIWQLDRIINERGLRIDLASVRATMRLVDKAKLDLDREMREVTGGVVKTCAQVAKLTEWLEAQGVTLPGVAKDDILEALDLVDLSARAKQALELRQEAARSSTAKLSSFLRYVSGDGRVRNCFGYHNTRPGRWSSKGVNVNNLPRPRAIYEVAELDPGQLFEAFRQEDPELLRRVYGDDPALPAKERLGRPLDLVADALRSFIWAAPGHDLIAVDYSGIEGALGAWLSDETWKLEAMQEIIADPKLPDMYRRAAAGILNSTTEVITKKHPMRQAVGKTSELALLFQGSENALLSMAANYGMKAQTFHNLYEPIRAAASPEIVEKADKAWLRAQKLRIPPVISKESWVTCRTIVLGWRANNPASVEAWSELEDATRKAVREPGKAVAALKDRVSYLVKHGFLWCRLPSGRCIAYAAPRLKDQVWAKVRLGDGSWSESEVMERDTAEIAALKGEVEIQGRTSPKVTALGVKQGKWFRSGLYGGRNMENLCLGIESDILRAGMTNCERAGYPIVLHCYDEAVAEMRRGAGSIEEMEVLMLDLPACYEGLPLAAHGTRSKRYKK